MAFKSTFLKINQIAKAVINNLANNFNFFLIGSLKSFISHKFTDAKLTLETCRYEIQAKLLQSLKIEKKLPLK